MAGHLFISQGDITQLSADAIAFSASSMLGRDGNLCSSFEANVPGFAQWYRSIRQASTTPIPVGTTFWMPMDSAAQPHGLVVVVSTGDPPRPDKAAHAVRSAIHQAITELRKIKPTGRLLIALPAFRVGRGGDHYQRMESARMQVLAARDSIQSEAEVDVVFMTYTPSLYRIFLEARCETIGPSRVPASYAALEQAIRAGACVLFVGAGMSRDSGLPGWDELIARMRQDLQIHTSGWVDNLDLAQWYREQFGNDRLADLLRNTFDKHGKPTLAHYLLMGLPIRHVITTNYDHLLEQALTALKRHPMPVVKQEEVAHTGGEGVFVVKLHGDATEPQEIVLSRDDYAVFFERRPAMALLLEGLLLNQTFFFVGYSLRDPNFRQLFSRIARMLKESQRPAFATSFEVQGDTASYLQRQWQRQQLALIPIEGKNEDEQKRMLLCFLDGLSERVTMQAPPLALAQDVPASPAMEQLRRGLELVGAEVEHLCSQNLSEQDVIFLASLVDFLADHGWRPTYSWTGKHLSKLYERLANFATDNQVRRRLLISALGNSEDFTDVQRLRIQIEQLRNIYR